MQKSRISQLNRKKSRNDLIKIAKGWAQQNQMLSIILEKQNNAHRYCQQIVQAALVEITGDPKGENRLILLPGTRRSIETLQLIRDTLAGKEPPTIAATCHACKGQTKRLDTPLPDGYVELCPQCYSYMERIVATINTLTKEEQDELKKEYDIETIQTLSLDQLHKLAEHLNTLTKKGDH